MELILKDHCLKRQDPSKEVKSVALEPDDWEKRWIEEALRGDVQAFERIVLAYQKKVFNLAFRMLGEREEAEDLTQEVFLNVFRHLSKFRGKSQFSTWIYQVTLNHCRNRIKYLKRRYHHAKESLDSPVATEEGSVDKDLKDPGDIPEEVLFKQEVQTLVHRALGMLREDYREVVVLRDIQGMSYQEIAKVVGLPEGTLKSRLHRARMELKEILERMGVTRG